MRGEDREEQQRPAARPMSIEQGRGGAGAAGCAATWPALFVGRSAWRGRKRKAAALCICLLSPSLLVDT
jgi:hypothetical protein